MKVLICSFCYYQYHYHSSFFFNRKTVCHSFKCPIILIKDITNDNPLIIAGELPRPHSPGEAVIRGEDGRPVAQWMLRGEKMTVC